MNGRTFSGWNLLVWRRHICQTPKTELQHENLTPPVKSDGVSKMVWGCCHRTRAGAWFIERTMASRSETVTAGHWSQSTKAGLNYWNGNSCQCLDLKCWGNTLKWGDYARKPNIAGLMWFWEKYWTRIPVGWFCLEENDKVCFCLTEAFRVCTEQQTIRKGFTSFKQHLYRHQQRQVVPLLKCHGQSV